MRRNNSSLFGGSPVAALDGAAAEAVRLLQRARLIMRAWSERCSELVFSQRRAAIRAPTLRLRPFIGF
jgi:hypothetical protein